MVCTGVVRGQQAQTYGAPFNCAQGRSATPTSAATESCIVPWGTADHDAISIIQTD